MEFVEVSDVLVGSSLPSPTHSERIRPVQPDSDHSDQILTILTKFQPNSEQEIVRVRVRARV